VVKINPAAFSLLLGMFNMESECSPFRKESELTSIWALTENNSIKPKRKIKILF